MVEQKTIKIQNKQNELLTGMLEGTLSADKMGDRLIIICHGLADTKDNPAFVFLANKLHDETRIPVFRFDFSGNGESEGKFVDATYHKEVQDLLCVLEYFSSKGVKKICLIGHSMGGGVCQVVSGMSECACVHNIQTLVSLAGVSKANSFRDKYPELIETIERDGIGYIWEARFGKRYPVTNNYLESAKTIDIMSYAKEVLCPVLALQGDEDTRIRAEHTREYLNALQEKIPHEFSFVHMNHGFNRHKGPEAMKKAVCDLVNEIIPFLRKHFL